MASVRVGILVFDGVEVLDFCGPFEVLTIVRRHDSEVEAPFAVKLIGTAAGAVTTAGGMRVVPDTVLTECLAPAILIVPGGPGISTLLEDTQFLSRLAGLANEATVIASVCTGALLLGHAGLLTGLRVTTHWRALERLALYAPGAIVESEQRVVEDGSVITSAGVSAGIDMALRLVENFCGPTVARETARMMEYVEHRH